MAEYKFKITYQATQVVVNDTNTYMVFDGRVLTIPAELWALNPASDTIRIYNSSGVELERYVVHFDAVAQEIQLWIKLDSVSSASDTDFWIHCGGDTAAFTASPYAAHWPLEDLNDISINSNTLTNVHSTPFEPAKIEDGPHFDGANDNLNTTTLTPWSLHTAGTISTWIKFDSDSGNWEFPISFGRNADATITQSEVYTSPAANNLVMDLRTDGTARWIALLDDNTLDPLYGNFFHLTIVQNGVAPVIYINGNSENITWHVSTTDKTKWLKDICTDATNKVDNLTFGGRNRNSSFTLPLDGFIDNVIITSDVWTANQVVNHYNNENDPDACWVCSDLGPAVSASAALTLPMPEVDAPNVYVKESASGDIDLPMPEVDANAYMEEIASGNIDLPVIEVDASATRELPCISTLALPVPAIAANATLKHPASAALTLPMPDVSANTVLKHIVVASLTLPVPELNAVCHFIITASSSLTLPVPEVDATVISGVYLERICLDSEITKSINLDSEMIKILYLNSRIERTRC